MNRRFAVSVLSTLLYVQALLGFAGLASVVIKHERSPVEVAAVTLDHAIR